MRTPNGEDIRTLPVTREATLRKTFSAKFNVGKRKLTGGSKRVRQRLFVICRYYGGRIHAADEFIIELRRVEGP